jgi:hypothetical protein
MKTVLKYAAAVALTGALALAAVSPSQARGGRNAAAAIGFGAGALVGAAAASNYCYYDRGGYGPGYAYDPGYAYEDNYAYEAAPVYAPAPTYYYRGGGNPYNREGCGVSPASPRARDCN